MSRRIEQIKRRFDTRHTNIIIFAVYEILVLIAVRFTNEFLAVVANAHAEITRKNFAVAFLANVTVCFPASDAAFRMAVAAKQQRIRALDATLGTHAFLLRRLKFDYALSAQLSIAALAFIDFF